MSFGVFVQVNEDSPFASARPLGYIIQENGCWDWVGYLSNKGYGIIRVDGKNRKAHRIVYEQHKGPIPDGLHIDHLCRNPSCVNPAHLEAVTNWENVSRGVGYTAIQARKTHCLRGHPFDEINTYHKVGGGRDCNVCRKRRGKLQWEREKAAKQAKGER